MLASRSWPLQSLYRWRRNSLRPICKSAVASRPMRCTGFGRNNIAVARDTPRHWGRDRRCGSDSRIFSVKGFTEDSCTAQLDAAVFR